MLSDTLNSINGDDNNRVSYLKEKVQEKVEKVRENNAEKIGEYLEKVGGFTGDKHTKERLIVID